MKKTILTLGLPLIMLTAVSTADTVTAQNPQPTQQEADDEEESEETEEEESDDEASTQDIRENPVIDIDGDDIDIPVPSFINKAANHIIFNGADWMALKRAFANSSKKPVSIVHIGDSHLQADINGATTRELLQYDFGNSGRGIITPLKMSGTNQPTDYIFSSNDSWTPVKLMSRTWSYPMGFTGTSIHPGYNSSSLTIGTKTSDDYNPFSSFTIFHGGKLTIDSVVGSDGYRVHYKAIPSRDYTQIVMASQETQVKVYFSSKGDLTVYGVSLSGDRPGVFYHVIGNNGATYATYNRIGTMGHGIAPLDPNLVIISLGTNEAFGRLNNDSFYHSIDRLVQNIRSANPNAQILLTTPMECQKSYSKKVSKKVPVKTRARRSKKRKRRRSTTKMRTVTTTTRSYRPNDKIAQARNQILKYGADNGIAVLDWYEVAGGSGASNTWISNGLFSKDRIHHSGKGYHLQGRLLYDALIDALTSTNK